MDPAIDLASRVVGGHATASHLREFKELGVGTQEEYKTHLIQTLRDPKTLCFRSHETANTWRRADIYYNASTNTLIVDPANRKHEPTALRPKQGKEAFDQKHRDAEKEEGRLIPIAHGMRELERWKRAAELARRVDTQGVSRFKESEPGKDHGRER